MGFCTHETHRNPYPYPWKPIPMVVGMGFCGYGYGFAWDTQGLPMTIPTGHWFIQSWWLGCFHICTSWSFIQVYNLKWPCNKCRNTESRSSPSCWCQSKTRGKQGIPAGCRSYHHAPHMCPWPRSKCYWLSRMEGTHAQTQRPIQT